MALWGPAGTPFVECFLSPSPDEKQVPPGFYRCCDARTLTAHLSTAVLALLWLHLQLHLVFVELVAAGTHLPGPQTQGLGLPGLGERPEVLALSLANKGKPTCNPLGSGRAQTPCHLSPWPRAFGTAQPSRHQPFQQLLLAVKVSGLNLGLGGQ